MKYHRPYPQRISQWDNMDEIIYECPNCGTSFGFYSNHEKFCHNCGTEINWEGVPTHCPENIKNMYHSADTIEGRKKAMETTICVSCLQTARRVYFAN